MGHVIYLLTACGILQKIPPKLLNELIGQSHPRQINNSFLFHVDGSCVSRENLQAVFPWDSQLLIEFRLKSLAGRLDWELHSSPSGSSLEEARAGGSSLGAARWQPLLRIHLCSEPEPAAHSAGILQNLCSWLFSGAACQEPDSRHGNIPRVSSHSSRARVCPALTGWHFCVFLLGVSGEEKMDSGNPTWTNDTWQAGCCRALDKSSSKTSCLIQKYPRREAGSGETGAKAGLHLLPLKHHPACVCILCSFLDVLAKKCQGKFPENKGVNEWGLFLLFLKLVMGFSFFPPKPVRLGFKEQTSNPRQCSKAKSLEQVLHTCSNKSRTCFLFRRLLEVRSYGGKLKWNYWARALCPKIVYLCESSRLLTLLSPGSRDTSSHWTFPKFSSLFVC